MKIQAYNTILKGTVKTDIVEKDQHGGLPLGRYPHNKLLLMSSDFMDQEKRQNVDLLEDSGSIILSISQGVDVLQGVEVLEDPSAVMPMQEGQVKIETPPDIYDYLFDVILRGEMDIEREHGDHANAEHVLRIIEFLEKALVRGDE